MTKEEFLNMPEPYPYPCEECAGPADVMIATGKDFFVWFWCEKCQTKHDCVNGIGDIMAMYNSLEAKARSKKCVVI
jgi:predicted nucleic acid-binding Zn ribbon protein